MFAVPPAVRCQISFYFFNYDLDSTSTLCIFFLPLSYIVQFHDIRHTACRRVQRSLACSFVLGERECVCVYGNVFISTSY